MKIRRRLEPERQAQDLAVPEPAPHGLRCIALEQAEVFTNDLAYRQVRDPPAV
jgi:hypothetical protein